MLTAACEHERSKRTHPMLGYRDGTSVGDAGILAARGRRERRKADVRGTFTSAAVCHRTSRGVVTFFCAVANVTGRDYVLARYRLCDLLPLQRGIMLTWRNG